MGNAVQVRKGYKELRFEDKGLDTKVRNHRTRVRNSTEGNGSSGKLGQNTSLKVRAARKEEMIGCKLVGRSLGRQ